MVGFVAPSPSSFSNRADDSLDRAAADSIAYGKDILIDTPFWDCIYVNHVYNF